MKRKCSILFWIVSALIISMLVVCFHSCAPIKQTTSSTEVKKDSTHVSDTLNHAIKSEIFKSDCTQTVPPVINKLTVTVAFDSCGNIKPIDVNVQAGQSSLSVKSEGKKLNIQSTCEGLINHWRKEVAMLTDSLNHQQAKVVLKDKIVLKEKLVTNTEYKTPFYIWILIGVLICIIIFLYLKSILSNSIISHL